MQDLLTAFFWSGDAIRSRSVGAVVLAGTVDIPAPADRLRADWERDIATHLCLQAGDVEEMPLARARRRWPDYQRCVQAVSAWTRAAGLDDVLATSDVALMACRGAHYHHDGAQYANAAFCNLFVSEDKDLDVHFQAIGLRIPLVRGTVLIFDTCQPHAVIDRRSARFNLADFPAQRDCSQLFLTWELPIENSSVARALGVTLDPQVSRALTLQEQQLEVNGVRAHVCAESGRWSGGV